MVALAIGLTCFSVISLVAIDRTLRTTLDMRLATAERIVVATATDKTITSNLRARLVAILGVQQNGAIVFEDGTIAIESAAVPDAVLRAGRASFGDSPLVRTVVNGTAVRLIAGRLQLSGGRRAVALLWRPLDVLEDYERVAAVVFGASSLIILGLTGLFARRIIRRALQPLRLMAAGASEIEASDLTRRLRNVTWDVELQELATTFDRMIDRLEAAFRRQRQFTADASHDLRAPLSVMRAEIDLALRRPREVEPDREAFISMKDEVRDLERLIDALLLAARADGDAVGVRALDVADVVARTTHRIEAYAKAHDVVLASHTVREIALVDADILDRILLSILHNAVKFSPANGTVWIATEKSASMVLLTVCDEGPGFSDDALRHAFDRFWRDDTARGRSGSGLGLSIAKASIDRLGGSISIANDPHGGARVELYLPGSTSAAPSVALVPP
jgi:signal transduction histidine kinase